MWFDRLAFRIACPFALLAAVLVGAVGWHAAQRTSEGVRRRLEVQMKRSADLLGRLGGAYDQEYLARIGRTLGLGVAIRDVTGVVRHTLDPQATRPLERLLERGAREQTEVELAGVNYRVEWGSVRGPLLEELVILAPEREIALELEQARASIVAGTLVAMLAAAALAAVLARGVVRPLAALALQTRRLAAGELDSRIAPRGARELRELAASFNTMAESMARSQAELVAAREQAVLGRVASSIAHEIRNPLASIRMAIQLQAEQAAGEAERRELEIVVAEVDRLDTVARELLNLGRPQPLDAAPIDVRTVVERAIGVMRARIAHRGLAVELRLPGEPVVATVDAGKVTQILGNLVLNACDASPAGGTIGVSVERDGAAVSLAVEDHGAGAADPAALFHPFYSTKPHGTGLGLATSRQLACAHGGDLRYERMDGVTRFTVRLPVG